MLNFFKCCVFCFLLLKLTDYDLIFKNFFFKVQVNINLGSNTFYFLIWALFIVIETQKKKKKTLKIQKTKECKKCYSSNKSQKSKKK